MLRLPVLLLTTMGGILAAMLIWGDGDLRSERRPAPAPVVAAAEPEAAPADEPPAEEAAPAPAPETASAEADPEGAPAPAAEATEVAGGIERFAGPALQPSPEFAAQDQPAPESGEASLWVSASRLNLRAGPGAGAAVVTGLDGGTALVPLGPTDGEWIEVRAPSGQTGFVSSQFVTATPPQ